MPGGMHVCHFYDGPAELLAAVVPFIAAGVARREACVVLVAELTLEATRQALGRELPDVDRCLEDGTLEIAAAEGWYRRANGGLAGACDAWSARLAAALARGRRGLRLTGTTSWVPATERRSFCAYEHALDRALGERPMTALCGYPLATCGPAEILEAGESHRLALVRRDGVWEAVRTRPEPNGGTPEVVPEGEWRRRERGNIIAALRRSGGRVYGAGGAAELLDLKPSTLQSRMRALKLRATDIVT